MNIEITKRWDNIINDAIDRARVEACTRKLRSRWSLEVAQDLLAYKIASEIDREMIRKIEGDT